MPRFRGFLNPHHPAFAGFLLFACAAAALAVANSPWAGAWEKFWHWELALTLGPWHVANTLLHWINDGLMALFFFVVGLELKREFLAGSLSNPKAALLPMAAALGGMVVPALIYAAFNPQEPGLNGWGVPMATDIAFAVGILALLGTKVPLTLKVFVTALAIADDLGAVLVIAFFYTSHIDLWNLAAGLFFLFVLVGANALGVRKPLFYALVGVLGIWLSFLSSGIHASIAGVLIAFTIPARARIDEVAFASRLKHTTDEFLAIPPNDVSLLEPAQVEALGRIQDLTRSADTPLQRIEHGAGPFVNLVVMPVFALANAGISFSGPWGFDLTHSVTLGVGMGLVVGKWVGVVGVTSALLALGWAALPPGMTRRHLVGAGFLCGVGFTMSLFITSLAFGEGELAHQAKLGVVVASALAGVLGALILATGARVSGTKKELAHE